MLLRPRVLQASVHAARRLRQPATLPRAAALVARPPARPLMSATSAEMVAAGAPFTNSCYLRPQAAGGMALSSSIPDFAPFTLPLAPDTPLTAMVASISKACDGNTVALIVNNAPAALSGTPPPTLQNLMGASVDLEIAGVRYCINEGARLAATGSGAVKKRSAATNSFIVVAGAVATLVSGLAFWSFVIPEENQRKYR